MAKAAAFKDGLMVIKFNTQKVPEFLEVKGKEWVAYGRDNLYPDYLISLFERSATNNAIITGKVNYILGEGWKANKKGLTIEAEAKVNDFVNSINPEESLDEISEKIVLDFEMYDGFCLELVQKKNKQDFSLYHLPFNKIRTNEDESEFYYSKDWKERNQSVEKTGFKKYPKFDGTLKQVSSIFYFRILSPRKGKDANVYPLPNYIGGTQAIETEIECQNYNLAEIKTGFSAGTMINFYNGIPLPADKEAIEEKIREKFTGSDRAGSFILNFADGKERASDVMSLSGNDLPERYTNLKKDASKTIFTSHKVSSPELFGVQEDSVFGGRTQITEKYELFYNTYISKRQRILEKIFNSFAGLKGVVGRLTIKPTIAIGLGIPDSLIAQAMPIDYVKEKLGIPIAKQAIGEGAKSVIDGINSLSPLVANKVLESMSSAEIRSLVGLTGELTKTQTTNAFVKVEKTEVQSQYYEANILDAFSKIGRSKDLFHIVKSKVFKFVSEIETLESEIECFKEHEEDKNKITTIPTAPPVSGRIEVLYSYEWKSGFTNKDLKNSRDFCKQMMKRDFFYTRAEINRLSNDFDTDVWQFRGGWYRLPGTEVNIPSCRHVWWQSLTKLK